MIFDASDERGESRKGIEIISFRKDEARKQFNMMTGV